MPARAPTRWCTENSYCAFQYRPVSRTAISFCRAEMTGGMRLLMMPRVASLNSGLRSSMLKIPIVPRRSDRAVGNHLLRRRQIFIFETGKAVAVQVEFRLVLSNQE